MFKRKDILFSLLFLVYLLLLSGVILFKLPFYTASFYSGSRVINLIPFQGAFVGFNVVGSIWREIIYNILLFIPFGIYLSLWHPKWSFWKKLMTIFLLSLFFETIQFIFTLGISDITDLINNTFGGLIGMIFYQTMDKLFKERANTVIISVATIVTILAVWQFGSLFYRSWLMM
ncbi:teicoplanin resistance protein VanZ [Enterococcus hirae]|nr:teicoplanin resistance protein VanZ [Enterococcus hirae]